MRQDAIPFGDAPVPVGTVAFLYTDIEGSSRLHENYPARMAQWHAAHDRLVERAVVAQKGHAFRYAGDGYCAAFATAEAALRAAMEAQRAFAEEIWDDELQGRVRMAVFAGSAEHRDGQYAGRILNRGSRLLNAAHGGQTLLSAAAVSLLTDTPVDADLRELGRYVLQGGVEREERIYQAVPRGFSSEFPPLGRHKGVVPVRPPGPSWDDAPRPFFGREEELRDLRRILGSPGYRLVTVTGLGGMGKSRLAQEVMLRAKARFPDGRFLVVCETIRTSEELAAALAAAMALPLSGSDPEQAVATALQGRKTLVVFDGFERLNDHAEVIDRLLIAAKGVKVLVTSRWSLGLEREAEYPLGPLTSDAEASLFANAASYAAPRFSSKANAEVIERICRRLEGLPLAILIAAGCLKWCDLATLERLVQTDLLDLEGPLGTRSSLRGVIEASVGALTQEDRDFLFRLAIFVGTFELDDVRAVLGGDRPSAIRRLAHLRDFSLVHAFATDGAPRFCLLGTVREALLGIATPKEEDWRRYRAWTVETAEAVRTTMENGEWTSGTAQFLDHLADFRSEVEHAAEEGDDDSVRGLVRSLARTALRMGLWHDFDRWMTLAMPRARGDDALTLALLGLAGARAQRSRDFEGARERWSARLTLAERIGDDPVRADAHFDLANLAWFSGKPFVAKTHLSAAADLAQRLNDPESTSLVLALEGEIACAEGDLALARQKVDAAIAIGTVRAGLRAFFLVLHKGAVVLRKVGDHNAAESALKKMLRAAVDRNGVNEAALAFLELGRLYREAGDPERARRSLEVGVLLYPLTGDRLRLENEEVIAALGPVSGKTKVKKHNQEWRDASLDILSDSM